MEEAADAVVALDLADLGRRAMGEWPCGSSLAQAAVRTVEVVKSVRGAVPVFRPVRFPGPLPEPAVRLSPQRALRKSQVGLTNLLVRRGLDLQYPLFRPKRAVSGSPVFTDATS